jgi:hypothetical protein
MVVDVMQRRGRRRGGMGARRGLGDGRGGATMDPAAVGEAPTWTQRWWRRGGNRGAGTRVVAK